MPGSAAVRVIPRLGWDGRILGALIYQVNNMELICYAECDSMNVSISISISALLALLSTKLPLVLREFSQSVHCVRLKIQFDLAVP